jgi:hypothetical protein
MTMRFEDGRTFTTRRTGSGAVQRVLWNGRELTRSWLGHAEVVGGGELVFELGEGGDWGRAANDRPGTPLETESIQEASLLSAPIMPAPILSAPWAVAGSDRFRGTQQVRLAALDPQAEIFWTLDADVALTGESRGGRRYTDPITLTETCDLRFVAGRGDVMSPVITARFNAIPLAWRLDIASMPNPQYTAGGPDALIDGRRGPDNWRTGSWHGYEGQDFIAVLDLGEARPLREAGAGFLHDMRSWIFMPRELIVEVSADGRTFVEAGRVGHEVPDREEGIFRADLTVPLDGTPVRAVRFHAVNYGSMPDWHLGAGGDGFIFVDELVVK